MRRCFTIRRTEALIRVRGVAVSKEMDHAPGSSANQISSAPEPSFSAKAGSSDHFHASCAGCGACGERSRFSGSASPPHPRAMGFLDPRDGRCRCRTSSATAGARASNLERVANKSWLLRLLQRSPGICPITTAPRCRTRFSGTVKEEKSHRCRASRIRHS